MEILASVDILDRFTLILIRVEGVHLNGIDSLLEVGSLLAILQYFMEDEVLSVLKFILLDIVLDLGLDTLLAFHSSQGRTSNLVSLFLLVAAEDQLCN